MSASKSVTTPSGSTTSGARPYVEMRSPAFTSGILPSRQGSGRFFRSWQQLDVAVRAVDADPLPVPDQPRRVLHPDDRGQAVLPGDHCAVGHQAADLGHETGDREEY